MAKYYSVVVMLSIVIVVMAMFAAPPLGEAAMSCNTVVNDLSPCISFVLIGGPNPSLNCCNGAKSLLSQAQSTPDRQAVCSCSKSAARSATPGIISNAAALPGKCGIPNFPYEISSSIDCSKYAS